ncbi:hypothetical protein HYALB_00014075 [Hymenoscyphus albidus]|uniref:Uncharacterized protein n=1 Tax=Hymenoscyphus albidus TaxID=595503 RepID=A0A9N9QCK0_9HELO|nr:hypothetical protein HYALB_00014075 [Hymenoscyphus albidus]
MAKLTFQTFFTFVTRNKMDPLIQEKHGVCGLVVKSMLANSTGCNPWISSALAPGSIPGERKSFILFFLSFLLRWLW